MRIHLSRCCRFPLRVNISIRGRACVLNSIKPYSFPHCQLLLCHLALPLFVFHFFALLLLRVRPLSCLMGGLMWWFAIWFRLARSRSYKGRRFVKNIYIYIMCMRACTPARLAPIDT